jgi:glycosyltransferase involved in cell wall biosynthesis
MIFIGPFPKPVHGQSLATQSMFEFFLDVGFSLKKVNVSSTGLRKILEHIYACLVILFSSKTAVYISLNSNKGLILNILLVLVARLKGSKLYLHYHAYDHIRRKSKVLYWLTKLAGKNACHIVLGETMAKDLRQCTDFELDTCIVNNSKLINLNSFAEKPRSSFIKIGHLSNLTQEKGLTDTIDVAIYLKDFFSIKLYLAGPTTSEYVQEEISRAKEVLGENIEYLGPLYGEAKDKFYSEIDYFIFPSQYKNEAEPLVVLEALSAGIPVIASNIGCISDDIDSTGGISLSMDENFKPNVKHYLSQIEHENKYFQASINAKNRFLELLMTSQDQLELLVERMRKD